MRQAHTRSSLFSFKLNDIQQRSPKECYVWGYGWNGLLGLGKHTKSRILAPQKLQILHGSDCIDTFKHISLGKNHSAFVSDKGLLFTSGKSAYGVLGNPKASAKAELFHLFGSVCITSPAHVESLSDRSIVSVECGYYHTIALDSYGKVWTWGYGGSSFPPRVGSLGHGSKVGCDVPKQVEALQGENVIQISSGGLHCCALTEDGRVFAWGEGSLGRLGTGGSKSYTKPVLLCPSHFNGEKVISVYAGLEFSMAITETGRIYAWGWGMQFGFFLDGVSDKYSLVDPSVFQVVPCLLETFDLNFVAFNSPKEVFFGCTDTGKVYRWARGLFDSPQEYSSVFRDRKITYVATGSDFMLSLDKDGICYSSGSGKTMCLGNGNKRSQKYAQPITAFNGRKVTHVFAGYSTAAAFLEPEAVPAVTPIKKER